MEILRTVCLAGIAATATFQSIVRPEVVMVTDVIDGQTIAISGHGRVRLAGIKAPRLGRGLAPDALFGREAKERLEGIVIRRYVRLEFVPGGRRAFVLLEDGTFVNAALVREGLAEAEHVTGRRGEELKRAEEQARAMRRGIWSPPSRLRQGYGGQADLSPLWRADLAISATPPGALAVRPSRSGAA